MLCGLPGAGKSSTLSAASNNFHDCVYNNHPIKHSAAWNRSHEFIYLGSMSGNSPGTDTPPYAHKQILDFLNSLKNTTTLAEGKRVTSTSLLTSIEALGYQVKVVHLACSETKAKARARAMARDSKPCKPLFAKQCLGAIRKVVAHFGTELELDGEGDVLENAKCLREFVATSVLYVICIYLNIVLLILLI